MSQLIPIPRNSRALLGAINFTWYAELPAERYFPDFFVHNHALMYCQAMSGFGHMKQLFSCVVVKLRFSSKVNDSFRQEGLQILY